MSENRKGEKNSFYGKHLSEDAKKKISTANSSFNNKKSIHIGKCNQDGVLIKLYGSLREAEKDGYKRRKYSGKINEKEFIECGGYLWKITS